MAIPVSQLMSRKWRPLSTRIQAEMRWTTSTLFHCRRIGSRLATHARNLDKLNPGHDLVQILLRLLEWDHNRRITASELAS
ncbi:hypothetical protein FOFC_02020 [Fusarium oxysporum]|nr:hypothetical protein FOFC_02020 [Fusarium oxysporum]